MKNKAKIVSLILFVCCQLQLHADRQTIKFTDQWRFSLNGDSSAIQSSYNDQHWRILNLPHDWSIESDFSLTYPATPGGGALPGGIGWYRKTFFLKKDATKQYYIDFDGVYWKSKVWLNGHFLGFRPNGYISFRYDLTPYLSESGNNVMVVEVDNKDQPNSRWYSGSGIYRNVWLIITDKAHIAQWGISVTTPIANAQEATVRASILVNNTSVNKRKLQLKTVLFDREGKTVGEKISPLILPEQKKNELIVSFSVNKPILWSVENPYLYTLRNILLDGKKIIDSENTKIGIRSFYFDADKGFFLNEKSLKIKGVCLHHDLGCFGAAINKRAIQRQLQLLKKMGCNAIRTSHNPPSPEFLNLCDEMGFVVMDEMFDMWRRKKSPFDYSRFFPEWHEQDLTDWVKRDRNHPSVFMWSIGNEILEQWASVSADTMNLQQANMILNFASTLSKKELDTTMHVNSLLTIKLADMVKKLDPTRPVTSGNNETEPSNYLFQSKSMDLIGFNYHEYNWGDEFHKKFPHQKLIITESTSALMSRGYYQMPSDSIFIWPKRWDIPFDQPVHQCSSYDNCHAPWGSTHERSWNMVKKYDQISGLFIWTGFDYLGEPTPFWWPSRSSYFGIIDLAGFPKDIYYMYQSEWTNQPVLHLFPHWNWKPGETVDVWAYYSQADEVELFLNGKSLGKKHKEGDSLHVVWHIPFQPGELKAVSYKDGKVVLSEKNETAGAPSKIVLTADRETIHADGEDVAFITAEAMDKDGNVVPIANNLIRFRVENQGTFEGSDNGDPTDSVSLKKPDRQLFNGKALVVVKSTKQTGKISVTATSDGLESAVIEIKTKR